MCSEASARSEKQCSSKGSFATGGHEVLLRKVIGTLLRNIDSFVKVGDLAIKGGPESV